MAQTEHTNNPDTKLAKFLLGEETRFRNAVRIDIQTMEAEYLPRATKYLQKWAAEKIWKSGYEMEVRRLSGNKFDFDNTIGIAVSLDLNHIPPTVRQFCYQFVRLAEITAEENDHLVYRRRQLEKHLEKPFYKRWFAKTKYTTENGTEIRI